MKIKQPRYVRMRLEDEFEDNYVFHVKNIVRR